MATSVWGEGADQEIAGAAPANCRKVLRCMVYGGWQAKAPAPQSGNGLWGGFRWCWKAPGQRKAGVKATAGLGSAMRRDESRRGRHECLRHMLLADHFTRS